MTAAAAKLAALSSISPPMTLVRFIVVFLVGKFPDPRTLISFAVNSSLRGSPEFVVSTSAPHFRRGIKHLNLSLLQNFQLSGQGGVHWNCSAHHFARDTQHSPSK